jgi:hypothetical protein
MNSMLNIFFYCFTHFFMPRFGNLFLMEFNEKIGKINKKKNEKVKLNATVKPNLEPRCFI